MWYSENMTHEVAKTGGNLLQPCQPQSFGEARAPLGQCMWGGWQEQSGGYRPCHDSSSTLGRGGQIRVLRLRT